MAYNDFTLESLKKQFGLQTNEREDYFARVPPVPISDFLRGYLHENIPLAFAIGTEKARSELLIMPVLWEVRHQLKDRISLFSGVEFNVSIERGLRGVCDFLLSLSPTQLTIEAPVVTIVEAKNDNLKTGLVQCIAEMVAAQLFNREQGNDIPTVFGALTTGTYWKFLRLAETTVYVDVIEYHVQDAERIVGIITAMIQEAFASQQPAAGPASA
jgi:hypothetical protein